MPKQNNLTSLPDRQIGTCRVICGADRAEADGVRQGIVAHMGRRGEENDKAVPCRTALALAEINGEPTWQVNVETSPAGAKALVAAVKKNWPELIVQDPFGGQLYPNTVIASKRVFSPSGVVMPPRSLKT